MSRPITLTANGGVQLDTSEKKYGSASALFDGVGDYITIDNSSGDINLGDSDFTVEFWLNLDSTEEQCFFDTRTTSGSNAVTIYYAGGLKFFRGGGFRINGATLSTGQWYHIALVRYGNTYRLYIDGTQTGSQYDSTSTTVVNSTSVIGAVSDNLAFRTVDMVGRMDELRISSTARYTTTFTPPSGEFANDSDTLLLVHFNGTDESQTFVDDNQTPSSGDETYFEAGYIDNGYLVYVANAIAAVEAESTVSASITKIIGVSAEISCTASVTATSLKTTDIDLFAFSDAAIAVQVDRIRDNNIAASTAFSIATDNIRFRDIDSDSDAVFSSEIVNIRGRLFDSTQEAAFSISASVRTDATASADLENAITLTADVSRNVETSLDLHSNFSVFISRYISGTRPQQVDTSSAADTSGNNPKYSSTLRLGNNGFLRMESSSDYQIKANEDFVFEFWWYVNNYDALTIAGVGRGQLVPSAPGFTNPTTYATPETNSFYFISPDSSSSKLLFRFKDSSTTFATITTTSRPALSTWNHYAAVRSGSTITIYVNGSSVGTATYSGTIVPPTSLSDRRVFINNTAGNSTTLFDELSFQRNANTILGLDDPISNDPLTHSLLMHFNGNFNDDISGGLSLESSASLTSSAALTGTLTASLLFESDLTAVSNLETDTGFLLSGVAALESQAASTTEISRIRSTGSDITAVSSVSVDISKIAGYSADISSTAQADISINVVRDADISTDSIATQLSAVAKIGNFLITLESQAAQNTTAEKITDITSEMANQAQLSADAIKAIDADADLQTSAAVSAELNYVRFAQALLSSEASQTTTVERTVGISADISSTAILAIEFEAFNDYTVDMDVISEVSADVIRIKQLASDLSTDTAMTIQSQTVIAVIADVTAQADFSIDANRTRDVSIDTDSIATQLTAAAKVGDFLITSEVVSTVEVSAVKTTDSESAMVTESLLSADVGLIRPFESQVSAESTTVVTAFVGTVGSADLTITATLTATPVKDTDATALQFSLGQLTASLSVIRSAESQLETAASLDNLVISPIRDFNSSVISISSLTAQPGIVANAEADFQAFYAQLSTGRIVHITPELTYMIQREIRTRNITAENRTRNIAVENREYTIETY